MSYAYRLSKMLSSPASGLAVRDTSRDAALHALTAEFEFILAGIALTGSIVNANALCRPPKPPYSLLSFMPPDPQLWPPVVADEFTGILQPPVMAQFVQLRDTLRSAKRAIEIVASKQTAQSHIDGREWFELSKHWRIAARHARDAQTALGARLSLYAHDATILLAHQLRAVEAGETPLIDKNGEVTVPAAGERRQHSRHSVDLPARLYDGQRYWTARVKNISATGVGLSTQTHLEPGAAVTIETKDGRLLPGVVIWSSDSLMGVRLREILFNSDPLFSKSPIINHRY